MATIAWDIVGERTYEAGLDRGVLYFQNGGAVPWNGLISIDTKVSAAVESIEFDGNKINGILDCGDFSATMKAFTYPDEFLQYEGILEDNSGVYLTDQPRDLFHLSYRTKVGDDLNGGDYGYKLHILYNLTAVATQKSYETLTLDPEPVEFQWALTAIPEEVVGYKPTAHLIIDSRKIDSWLLADIEAILYGDAVAGPSLPPLNALTTFIRNWARLIILDNGDETWTASTTQPGFITQVDATTYTITSDDIVTIDANTYTISSTDKNEEDIWQP